MAYVGTPENNSKELVLPFCHGDYGEWTQVLSFDSLSHLAGFQMIGHDWYLDSAMWVELGGERVLWFYMLYESGW